MQANLTLNEFRIKDTTISVDIPQNDLANLMYYLHCVYDVLKLPDLIPYMDYPNYYRHRGNINNIIYLAKLFNPSQMTSIGAFIHNEKISGLNRFYEITDEFYGIHANKRFVIGGKVVRIVQIMAYKSSWSNYYYYCPLQKLINPPKNDSYDSDDDSCVIF